MATTQLEPQGTSKFTDLPNGTKLYTEHWVAPGTDPSAAPSHTIVCVHGLGSTSTTFFPIIKPLLTHLPTAHILAYDWAGCGSSPLLPDPDPHESAAAHVADLDALIAASAPDTGTGALILVAHSAGTILTARWLLSGAPRAVARIERVVFLGGPIAVPVAPAVTAMQRGFADVVAREGPGAVVGVLTGAGMLLGETSVRARPLAVGMVRAVTLAQSAVGYARAIRAFSEDVGVKGEPIDWGTIQGRWKVLVINGEEDGMVERAEVERFLDASEHVLISKAGHTLTVEAPEETAEAIARFVTAT